MNAVRARIAHHAGAHTRAHAHQRYWHIKPRAAKNENANISSGSKAYQRRNIEAAMASTGIEAKRK